MKTNPLNILLVIAIAEISIQRLEAENKQLREHAGGYDRLRAAHGQLKGRVTELENRIASADETTRRYWTMIQNGEAEVRQLKEKLRIFRDVDSEYAKIERHSDQLKAQVLELGRQNIALAAEAERADLAEQQLARADVRIKELEAALVLANLSADSRDNVIQMVREAA
jgi:chromosome segregation ATPase